MKEDTEQKPSEDRGKQRRPYKKPELKRVLLRPEEAVLASCKFQGGSGPGSNNCRRGQTSCLVIGS